MQRALWAVLLTASIGHAIETAKPDELRDASRRGFNELLADLAPEKAKEIADSFAASGDKEFRESQELVKEERKRLDLFEQKNEANRKASKMLVAMLSSRAWGIGPNRKIGILSHIGIDSIEINSNGKPVEIEFRGLSKDDMSLIDQSISLDVETKELIKKLDAIQPANHFLICPDFDRHNRALKRARGE